MIIIDVKRYSRKQQIFIEALLAGEPIIESARKAETSVVTAYKWLNNGLRDDVENYRNILFEHSIKKLQQGMELAVDTLFKTLQDPKCSYSVKVSACKIIIENDFKLREQDDIINRLEQIEARLKESEDVS